ncbi:MAG: hypothetical protein ACI849_001742 [Patiriisocius sp.]|jgi:hypothetical protein
MGKTTPISEIEISKRTYTTSSIRSNGKTIIDRAIDDAAWGAVDWTTGFTFV